MWTPTGAPASETAQWTSTAPENGSDEITGWLDRQIRECRDGPEESRLNGYGYDPVLPMRESKDVPMLGPVRLDRQGGVSENRKPEEAPDLKVTRRKYIWQTPNTQK